MKVDHLNKGNILINNDLYHLKGYKNQINLS